MDLRPPQLSASPSVILWLSVSFLTLLPLGPRELVEVSLPDDALTNREYAFEPQYDASGVWRITAS